MGSGSFRKVLAAMLAVALAACGASTAKVAGTEEGQVGALTISVRRNLEPHTSRGDVNCVYVYFQPASGPALNGMMWNSDPGNSQGEWRFSAQQLPVGAISVWASAYASANCSGTPLYTNDPSLTLDGSRVGHANIVANQTASLALWLDQWPPPPAFQNTAPSIVSISIGMGAVTPGATTSLAAVVSDDGGPSGLSYRWTAAEGGGTFTSAAALATLWTAPSALGSYPITFTVTDAFGAATAATIEIGVAPPTGLEAIVHMNLWPVVGSIEGVYLAGQLQSFPVTAVVTDDDTALTYDWSVTGPCTLGPVVGSMANVVPNAVTGTCNVAVTATDPWGGHGSGSLIVPLQDPTPAVVGPLFLVYMLSPNLIYNPDGHKRAEIAAIPVDLSLGGKEFTWDDGYPDPAARFASYDGLYPFGGMADVWYTPPACSVLGGAGTYHVPVSVTMTLTATGAASGETVVMTLVCQ